MANVYIPLHILHNILIRLPLNSLLRFRCVSTHWKRLITDPDFMKLRPRRMTLIPTPFELRVLDDKGNSIVKCPDEFGKGNITILGTFHGIVLLFLEYYDHTEMMVLYNPFTGAFKILHYLHPPSLYYDSARIFGFGYGEDPDDLKIIIGSKHTLHYRYSCDVLSLKNGSWTTFDDILESVIFSDDQVGVFLNGFLHWVSCYEHMKIVALDLKKMVVSMMHVPDQCSYLNYVLGTLNGCLCMIDERPNTEFGLWVMKNQGVDKSWLKTCSFTLGWKDYCFGPSHTVCILEGGKIVMCSRRSYECQLLICDPSDGSYKKLELWEKSYIRRGIEYVESLVSPSDICFV